MAGGLVSTYGYFSGNLDSSHFYNVTLSNLSVGTNSPTGMRWITSFTATVDSYSPSTLSGDVTQTSYTPQYPGLRIDGVRYSVYAASEPTSPVHSSYVIFGTDQIPTASTTFYMMSEFSMPPSGSIDVDFQDTVAFVGCYTSGTLLASPTGAIAVEDVRLGDRLMLFSGETVPVCWIGRQDVFCTALGRLPICIRKDAIGPNMPGRDLILSPDHCLYLDGILVPAKCLINGASVVLMEPGEYTYWHVGLDQHNVLIAEGCPAESYLDTGNLATFPVQNGDLASLPDLEPCAPIIDSGARLDATRAWLLARAAHLGWWNADPQGKLVADGITLEPVGFDGWLWHFEVPEGTLDLCLLSRAAVPAEMSVAARGDRRLLGLSVTCLEMDGEAVDLSTSSLTTGWHSAEHDGDCTWRWTNGHATLPKARTVALAWDSLPGYPVIPRPVVNPSESVSAVAA